MSQEDVDLARRAFEEWLAGLARGDPTNLFDLGLVADDLEWILPPEIAGLQSTYRGREGFMEFMRTWTEDFDCEVVVEHVATLDRVVLDRVPGDRAVGELRHRDGAVGEVDRLHLAVDDVGAEHRVGGVGGRAGEQQKQADARDDVGIAARSRTLTSIPIVPKPSKRPG